jgi:hypothetical protein
LKPLKIAKISKIGEKKVFDIHHNLPSEFFLAQHPNLVVNNVIISNCSTHAGGVLITENLDQKMPLISVKGKMQTPWAEGQNVRHLEQFGFVKFDALGLSALGIIHNTIKGILREKLQREPTLEESLDYYQENLHPDRLNLNDQTVYENIFHKGKFVGVFQASEGGMQQLILNAKPRSIEELSAVSAIYRPGPLAASVDKLYVQAKEDPDSIPYLHTSVKSILSETSGLCIAGETLVTTDKGNIRIDELEKKTPEEISGITLPSFNEQKRIFEQDSIEKVKYMGKKKTILIETESGSIKVTSDHKILTRRGWIEAEKLQPNDEIASVENQLIH